jgi:hypothetical protein
MCDSLFLAATRQVADVGAKKAQHDILDLDLLEARECAPSFAAGGKLLGFRDCALHV